jgi:hypothetical protein
MTNQLTVIDRDSREITLAPSSQLMQPIDVEGMVLAVEAFHAFVSRILRPGVHFGRMPGVNKDFLWQPGAEEIFRAFNCRPVYETVREVIDPRERYAMFWRKCQAVSIATGEIVGEADAICSSDEFVENCKVKVPVDTSDGTVHCPEHGRTAGKSWDRGASLICTGKTAQPFDRVLPNALMKADKRAFVKCARTLGCASEFFTQDEELVIDAPAQGAAQPGAKAAISTPAPGTAWTAGEDYFLVCPIHGESKAKEWDRGKTLKCVRKTGRGKDDWCTFSVPKSKALPEKPAPEPPKTEPPWVTTIKGMLAESGLVPADMALVFKGAAGWGAVADYLGGLPEDSDWPSVYETMISQVKAAKNTLSASPAAEGISAPPDATGGDSDDDGANNEYLAPFDLEAALDLPSEFR